MNQTLQFMAFVFFAGSCMCRATVIADWSFEASQPNGSGNTIAGIQAEDGVNAASSIASGYHQNSSSWSSPSGDGTAHSFCANHWAVNDYFQFETSTIGFRDIEITFEQTSSSTGPSAFEVVYSTDGVTYAGFVGDTYAVGTTSWSSTGPLKATILDFDLSSIAAINDSSVVYFRLVDLNSVAAGGGSVGSSGTARVDDFSINGAVVPVPEPAWQGLVSAMLPLILCGLVLWRLRESQSSFTVN